MVINHHLDMDCPLLGIVQPKDKASLVTPISHAAFVSLIEHIRRIIAFMAKETDGLEDLHDEARTVEPMGVITLPEIEVSYPFLEIEDGAVTEKGIEFKIQVWS